MSFLEELKRLSEPAPQLPDTEDADFEGLKINETRFEEENDEDDGALRRRITSVDLNNDAQYQGTKVSRSEVFGSSSEMTGLVARHEDSDEGSVESEANEEDHDDDEDDFVAASDINNAEDGSSAEDDEELDANEDDENENEEENSESGTDEGEADGKISKADVLSNVDKDKENKKAESVRAQMAIWEQLLYVKIKLQAATRSCNILPRGTMAKECLKTADDSTKANALAVKNNCKKLVDLFMAAEDQLLRNSSLTKGIVGEGGGMVDSDDEEIESSEDEANLSDDEKDTEQNDDEDRDEEDIESEGSAASASAAPANAIPPRKKHKERDILSLETRFDNFRKTTLIKWEQRTRLTGPRRAKDAKSDFSAFGNNNIISQIDKILADKTRILKRFHTKRSDACRIGCDAEADEDAEIFDDDDFYQVLLKELIDKKSTNTSDPVEMTRHYIEMKKLHGQKSKRKVVDHGMSKDRKIKFVPIPKLVNFHPARPEIVEWSHEARNELFKSLFS